MRKDCYSYAVDMVVAAKMVIGGYLHHSIHDKKLDEVISTLQDEVDNTNLCHSTLNAIMIDVFNMASERREFLPDEFLYCIKLMGLVLLKHDADTPIVCKNWLPCGEASKKMLNTFTEIRKQVEQEIRLSLRLIKSTQI
jgi:hypothetical protein